MELKLGILTGARAGETLTFAQPTISVGRHAEVDLRFDPAADRAVSARHALLFFEEGHWHLRDLGSRNGTYVNDRPVREDCTVRNGDRITFGNNGPTIQVAMDGAPLYAVDATGASAPPVTGPLKVERIRMELARRTRRHRAAGIALAVLATGILGSTLFLGGRQRAAWDRERNAMHLQIDSMLGDGSRVLESAEQLLAPVRASLLAAEERVAELEEAVTAAEREGAVGRASELRLALDSAGLNLRGRRAAAALDLVTIQRRNRPAIARLFVEFESGEVTSATAFVVRADMTLVTSRRRMTDPQGRLRPRRIAVQFADSEQLWPARLLAVSDADLALLRVEELVGRLPTITTLHADPGAPQPGVAVALLGFPSGGPAGDPHQTVGHARPSLSAGVIRKIAGERMEMEIYGPLSGSGSPVMGADGQVLGIVLEGRTEGERRFAIGAPAAAVRELLQQAD